jgi:hypothetical protein
MMQEEKRQLDGRSRNFVASAQLQEKARAADAEASRQEIALVTDPVSALTSSKLRSDLDLSFA